MIMIFYFFYNIYFLAFLLVECGLGWYRISFISYTKWAQSEVEKHETDAYITFMNK